MPRKQTPKPIVRGDFFNSEFQPDQARKIASCVRCCGKNKRNELERRPSERPNLLNPLPAVLYKFRQDWIAFTADIKEMFH